MSIFNYKLYIFDLDGTIIDSEYSHYEAYNRQIINKFS
jgi:beta-phosphoglucomutase-like phosphatase (HAD superfamily)